MSSSPTSPQPPSQPSPPASSAAADVTLTREARTARDSGQAQPAARRQAQLPHERDQHPDSQAAPEAPNQEVGEQAFSDVSHGLVDTDDSLRKSSVDRRDATPVQPTGKVSAPREAKPARRA